MREPGRSTTSGGIQARAAQSPDSLYHGGIAHPGGSLPPMANGIRPFAGIPGFSFYSFPASGRCATQSHPPNYSTVYHCRGRSVLFLGVSGKILNRLFPPGDEIRRRCRVSKPGTEDLGTQRSRSIDPTAESKFELRSKPVTWSLEGSVGWHRPFASGESGRFLPHPQERIADLRLSRSHIVPVSPVGTQIV